MRDGGPWHTPATVGGKGVTIANGYGDVALVRRLLRQARPYWPHLGGLLLLSMLSTPLALLTPLPLKIVVDSVIGSRPLPGFLDFLVPDAAVRSDTTVLVLAVCLLFAVALVGGLVGLMSSVSTEYVGERMVRSLRARLF